MLPLEKLFSSGNPDNSQVSTENQPQNKLFAWKDVFLKKLRPWPEFIDKSRISFPPITGIHTRVSTNLLSYQSNYIIIFVILVIYSIVVNPWLLFGGVFLGFLYSYLFFVRIDPIAFGSVEVGDREKRLILLLGTVLFCIVGSFSSALFWAIGATVTVVGLHAVFMAPPEDNPFVGLIV
eukprot:TRINITY_DN13815_c0_g1_i1.p1 TRINITY_DN13815_c0_g1~~TRINITY_DN13815_c0_g1_i1.p1  ORF type:complete len:179 (-),score=19.95 TRINITY_DN13815_c0_g1_i1:99-635(-)